MNEQEKSEILAKLCGWTTAHNARWELMICTGEELFGAKVYTDGNLYNPQNAHLAWKVLNWASTSDYMLSDEAQTSVWIKYRCAVVIFGPLVRTLVDIDSLMTFPLKEAQRIWLDKILELALDSGLVENV